MPPPLQAGNRVTFGDTYKLHEIACCSEKNDDEAWDLGDFQFSDTQVGKVTYLNEQVSKSLKASVTDYTGGWQVGSTQHKKNSAPATRFFHTKSLAAVPKPRTFHDDRFVSFQWDCMTL